MGSHARTGLVVLALAAVTAAAGCSSSTAARELDPDVRHLQAGAPGEPSVVLTEAPDEELVLGSPFNDSDVGFIADMQLHHQQALAMTALVESRTDHEQLKLFVQRMDISQQGELEQLEAMMAEHRAAVARTDGAHSGGHSGHSADGDHSDMPGMLTDTELAALEAARGDDFVRLFLVGMTKHHTGALQMVADLLADEAAAADPRLYQFAQHVDSDQRIELNRMERMWAELPA